MALARILIVLFLATTVQALTYTELKAETDNLYKDRTLQDWKDQSDYRGITQRSQKDFDWLLSMYPDKIGRLTETFAGTIDLESKTFLIIKIARLKDKFATCCQEVKMRKDGDVVRTDLHDQTDYFIDYVGGNDGSAGTAIGTAWKTITKYTTTTVRTPGDRAFLRANITWLQGTEAVDITFDEDGTDDLYIKIIGCDSVTNDPWSDSSDVLPIIDFEDAAFQWFLTDDHYWNFERLDSRRSNDAQGCWRHTTSHGTFFLSCFFQDQAANRRGVIVNSGTSTFESCTFINNAVDSIRTNGGRIIVKSCTFNGGGGESTDCGILAQSGVVYVEDSTFGVTTAHDTADISAANGADIYCRNCTLTAVVVVSDGGTVYSEDDDATFESQITTLDSGIVIRETTKVNGSGANSSARMAPAAECGPNNPLTLGGNPLSKDFKIWLSAAQHTVTVYANRVDSDWATEPVAANFYIQASYLNNGGTAGRALSTASAQDIADSDTWTGFTTTFTMAREGWAYIRVSLEKFETGKFIYVDIKPVVS